MFALCARALPLGLIVGAVLAVFGVQGQAARDIVLNHVAVIDVTGGRTQPDMAVLIRGNRIAAIERAAGFRAADAQVIDLTGTLNAVDCWDLSGIRTKTNRGYPLERPEASTHARAGSHLHPRSFGGSKIEQPPSEGRFHQWGC